MGKDVFAEIFQKPNQEVTTMKRIKLYPWKRLLSLLLCICICLGSLPVMLASAAGSATGMGLSENNPLEIDTAEKLYEFASNYNDGSIYQKLDVAKDAYLYIHLTADINLHPYSGGEGWLPIGSGNGGNTDFKGSFDGGGFTVSGLGINRRDGDTEGADNQGLFGIVAAGSTVKNVALADASVSGGNRVGLLAGQNLK